MNEPRPLSFLLNESSFLRSQSGNLWPAAPDAVPGPTIGDAVAAAPARAGVTGGGGSMGSSSSPWERARGSFTVCTTSVIDDIAVSFCRSAVSFQEHDHRLHCNEVRNGELRSPPATHRRSG